MYSIVEQEQKVREELEKLHNMLLKKAEHMTEFQAPAPDRRRVYGAVERVKIIMANEFDLYKRGQCQEIATAAKIADNY